MTLNKLKKFIYSDAERMNILQIVRSLHLNDCWVGAGFVRNLVWDRLHNYSTSTHLNDVDVIFFDSGLEKEKNSLLEEQLTDSFSGVNWSVKNQAYMHQKQGHLPYDSSEEALRFWVETATAVAVRLNDEEELEVLAPYDIQDLFDLVLRPVSQDKLSVMNGRIRDKNWLEIWPNLKVLKKP